MPQAPLYDYKQYDFENPAIPLEEIRKLNPQRFEMEQLTGIVWASEEQQALIGFKDVTTEEFWCRGHMPGYPLMPGVMQCEAAAQLGGYLARRFNLLKTEGFIGFGGINQIRFRMPVKPPCRLVLIAKVTRIKLKMLSEFDVQGWVDDQLVFNGSMIGVSIPSPA